MSYEGIKWYIMLINLCLFFAYKETDLLCKHLLETIEVELNGQISQIDRFLILFVSLMVSRFVAWCVLAAFSSFRTLLSLYFINLFFLASLSCSLLRLFCPRLLFSFIISCLKCLNEWTWRNGLCSIYINWNKLNLKIWR